MRARLVCVGLVGLVAMLAAARAHADWRAGPVLDSSKPPNDVLDVWGVGTYAVGYDDDNSTRGGAYVVVDGGTVRAFPVPMANTLSVGTFYQPVQQCFVLMASDGRRSTLGPDDAGCGGISPNQPITYADFESGETFRRVKHAPGGGATVVVGADDVQKVLVSDAGIHVPGVGFAVVWRDGLGPLEPPPYAVARVDGGVHFFVGTSSAANAPRALRGSIDPKTDAIWNYYDWNLGLLQAVELFAAAGRAQPLVVLGTRTALLQGDPSLIMGDPGAVRVVEQLPAAQQLVGLSMNVGAGSDAGEGFGMALVHRSDGGLRVLSPVPAGSQTDAGTVWRERVLPPGAGMAMADVSQVACHGAAYCVLTAPGKTSDNLFLYSNAAKPVLSVDGGPRVRVDAGWVEFDEDLDTTLALGAIDPDGDPVRVTAGREDLEPTRWSVGTPSMLPGEPVGVPVSTEQVCVRTRVGRFQVRASDGWREHDLQEDVDVYVQHTRLPSPPDVRRGDGGLVPRGGTVSLGELSAGGPELTLTFTDTNTSDGCVWTGRRWRQVSPDGPTLETLNNDTTARIRPPATFCEAAGREFSFVLEATDQGGLTVPRTFTLKQQPWGAPEPVFAASNVAALQDPPIGASVTVQPDSRRHACQDARDFPGVVTSWTVTQSDGGVPDSGYRIQTLLGDGGPDLQRFPVETAGLVLRATECRAESVLTVRAAHRVASMDGGLLPFGPESQRQVRVPPGWTDLSRGKLQVIRDKGVLGLDAGLDCATQRGLSAVLWLSSDESGETTPRREVPLPEAAWPLPSDVECGRYTLHAVLKDSSGEGSEQDPYPLVLPGAGVRLEALAPEVEVKAECGRGASFALSDLVRPLAGFCQTPDYAWTSTGDAGLEQISASGEPIRLATVSRELDDLIGEKVTVLVKASKGGEDAGQSAQVLITTEPFVQVDRRTELPAAGETGLVGVLVRLTNTNACDVHAVVYEERLEGLSFVKESAQLDGEVVDAGDMDDRLTVVLPLLEAGATRTLSYVARPHLLGERRMEGTAKKNDVRISMSDTSEPPREGCGCTSAGAAPMLLVLALLGALSRRRPTTRS